MNQKFLALNHEKNSHHFHRIHPREQLFPTTQRKIYNPKTLIMRNLATLILTFITVFSYSQDRNRQINNVKAFAKMYGYVRYFHPSDEAASINWEKFAIYGSNEVLNAANDDVLLNRLRELFYPIAPSVMIFKKSSPQLFEVNKITPPNINEFKTIAWQHSGLGVNNLSAYKSIRINRPASQYTMSGNASAQFTQFLDAKPLQGKEIRFSGWMKVELKENEEGTGYFWLGVDTESGMGPYYTMNERPFATTDWREYSLSGKITSKASRIGYGAKLTGKGKILVDDLKLQVKEGNEWKDIAIMNSSFENVDKDGPADWDVQSIGFTKPGFDSSYSYTININDKHDGKSSFEVFSIENNAQKKGTISKNLFDQHSIPGETVEKPISETLRAIIPLALYGKEDHTYPVGDSVLLRKLKVNINQFSKTANKGTDLALRLGDVAITWNIFKHFFPYWEDASKDAEIILTQTLQKSVLDKTELDFKQTLQLMTEPLNDGHIKVYLNGDVSEEFQPNILIDIAENKVVVEKVADTFLEKYILPGDIVEKIDGRAVTLIVKEKENYISGSPQWKNSRILTNLLAGAENTELILSLNRNGNTFDQAVIRRHNMIEYYNAADNERKKSGEIEEGIYYIDLAKLPADSIKKWANKLSAAKAVICDLRCYPNGNHNLINYLLKENVQTKSMFVPRILYPDHAKVSYAEFGWNMKPEQPHFTGKIVFLTDGRAISYAESFMGYIKDFKLATIIGGPTAGTNGNINRFTLPGGYTVVWTGMLVKNHDGSKHHIRGVVPDIPTQRTIKGIAEGRDELLLRALEFIKEGK